MISNWKNISFESTATNQGCTFLSFNRSENKHSRQNSFDKKDTITQKKNKIKCPQSKHSRQQSQYLKTLEKKNISFSTSKQDQKSTILQKKIQTNKNNTRDCIWPPMQKNKSKLLYQPLQKLINSSRSDKVLIKNETKSTKNILQFRQNNLTTHKQHQQTQNLISNISFPKTLQELFPKVVVSIIDPTFYEIVPMEQSKIVIDFFNLPEQELLIKEDQWANIN